MPIRNPFKRSSNLEALAAPVPDPGFRDVSIVGAQPSATDEPTEFQLSEIDDSGVFIPPPATEKPRFWQTRSNSSLVLSQQRTAFCDSEPFNMSRESFDSYRRSFDISARSPISFSDADSLPRRSLDSSLVMSLRERRRADWPEDHVEEDNDAASFEDVKLNEDSSKPVLPKRRGFFVRFGGESEESPKHQSSQPLAFFSRKRAQSGQGSELGSISREAPRIEIVTQ